MRFLHTADWQLGMRRHFLSPEALPRYRQARIDAIVTMARIADEQRCGFVVVCGDVFESNQIDRATLLRALEALDAMPCPVFLLPGNHDALDAGTIYRREAFSGHPKVRVLASREPVAVVDGVEVVGAPWRSRRPQGDLVAETLSGLGPAPGLRILAGHGETGLAGDHSNPARIELEPVRAALADGRVHYVALGDRHSATEVCPRVWYSGTPEPTAFRESDPGFCLVVDLDAQGCRVERHRVARWRFVGKETALGSLADVDALASWLDALPFKSETVLRLELAGSLSLKAKARLDEVLAHAVELCAGVKRKSAELAVLPDDLDLSDLGLTGFPRDAVDELTRLAESDVTARDALALLYRLAGGAAR